MKCTWSVIRIETEGDGRVLSVDVMKTFVGESMDAHCSARDWGNKAFVRWAKPILKTGIAEVDETAREIKFATGSRRTIAVIRGPAPENVKS